MSGYDKKFDAELIRDAELDNIIDADDDDKIIDQMEKYTVDEATDDVFVKDVVDTSSVENGAKGLGDDIGTNHPSKGAEAPKNDSSDEPIVKQERSDTGKSPIIDDAPKSQTNADADERNLNDEIEKAGNKVDKMEIEREEYFDNFDKAQNSLLDEADEDILSAQNIPEEINTLSAPSEEDIADDVDAATGLDTPIPTSPNDIPIGDNSNNDSVLSVGEGKLEDLIVGDHADSTIKDGGMVKDFKNPGENGKSTVNDGQELAVGDHADSSATDGKMVKDFMNNVEDHEVTTDDSFKEASVSSSEDLVDELEDEDIEEIEDTTEVDKDADAIAKDLADDEDEEDDLLDQLLD